MKREREKGDMSMKKRNFLTTAALAALVAAQMAMPVMAAKTNNKLDKIDTTKDYTADDLKNNGHTTFGVIEVPTSCP